MKHYNPIAIGASTADSFVKTGGTGTQMLMADGTVLEITPHFKGLHLSEAALIIAHPSGVSGDFADVDAGVGADVARWIWDVSDDKWVVQSGIIAGETSASIKAKYEANADTNAFTDDEKTAVATNSAKVGFTAAGVLATILSGLSIITGGDVVATDTVIQAFGKLQKNINDLWIAVNLNTAKVSFPEAPIDTKQYARKDGAWNEVVSSGTSSSNIAAGAFSGVIDVSQGNNVYYNDYDAGAIVNLTLSAIITLGSIATVRVKGDLLGTIPSLWNYSGQPITANASKFNELTLLYATSNDIRIVNRVVNYVDTTAPSVPTGLASSNITDTSATLTWNASTDNVGVVAYKIRKDGVLIASPTVLTYSVTGLTASTSYSFTVSAIDMAGNESAQSIALNVSTIATQVVAFETEYQAVLDYATANSFELPSTAQQIVDNNKVKYLKQVGAWTELDNVRIFNATYTPSSWAVNFYRLNFKNPSVFTLTANTGLEPTYVSGSGFKVLGNSGKFAKTGFIPATHAVKMTNINMSVIVGLFDVPTTYAAASYWYGGRDANDGRQILLGNPANNEITARNCSMDANYSINQSNVNAHYHTLRTSGLATDAKVYINGDTIIFSTQLVPANTSTLPTFEQYLFGINNAGALISSIADIGIKYELNGSNLESLRVQIYQIMNETYIQ